jgi:hypothetical protein
MMPLSRGKILPPFARFKASEKLRPCFLWVGLSRLSGGSRSYRHQGGAATGSLRMVFVTRVLLPSVAVLFAGGKAGVSES